MKMLEEFVIKSFCPIHVYMKLTISILITYYNERELLQECLLSIANQLEPSDEIIVYDDASTWPPSEYVPEGVPVRIIRGETNIGPARGRNVLLQAARGDYIHFHDSDDLFHPEWAQKVRQQFSDSNVDAVFTEISSYRDNKLTSERVIGLSRLLPGKDLLRFCLHGAMLVPSGTYRRGSVLNIHGYREQLWQSEDFDFHVRLAASGIHYAIIDEPLVMIRIRPSSRSQNHLEVWTSAFMAVQWLARELPSCYQADLAEAAARIGSMLFKLGARAQARQAFQLAIRLGPPTYSQQRRLYQILARLFGPEAAEDVSTLYRNAIPQRMRSYLNK
jgi:hypothetical protein